MRGDLVGWARECARRSWALRTGPDAALHRRCAAIMTIFGHCGGGARFGYGFARARIEEEAAVLAPLMASTPEGVRALAEVTWTLNYLGFVSWAGITLGASLARNIMVRGRWPLPEPFDQTGDGATPLLNRSTLEWGG